VAKTSRQFRSRAAHSRNCRAVNPFRSGITEISEIQLHTSSAVAISFVVAVASMSSVSSVAGGI